MNRKKEERPHNKFRTDLSLNFHLIRFLVLFLIVTILVTWIFQVGLLDLIYEKVRERDMINEANELAHQVGTEQLREAAYEVSTESMMSVLVYQITGQRAILTASEGPVQDQAHISMISSEVLTNLYQKAVNNDGSLQTQLTFDGAQTQSNLFQRIFSSISLKKDPFSPHKTTHMVHIRVCNDASGNEYMIMLNSSMEPMSPLVHTLQRQFILIFFVLLLVSLLFVIPMSRRISRPLAHMSEAAKQLASGNYNADFSTDHSYREIKELSETLTYASQELSKADRMQKELIANISHDLRTPLTMIRGYAEVMRDIPEENSAENIQILIDETNHLTELVNDLMDLSKIQSGVHAPVMEFFDITALIRDVMERYEAFTKAKGYHINLQAEGSVPVFADRSLILQVVYNLINNAINYTGDDLTVTVIQTVTDNTVRISIQDTGDGIPADQLDMIWDRYYKVDKVHRSAKIGTGIGLSIVKAVLQIHNAPYGVESTERVGSIFWFELPVSAPPKPYH